MSTDVGEAGRQDSISALVKGGEAVEPIAENQLLSELEHKLFGRPQHSIRLSHYILLERIGEGGFGAVYSAYDPRLDRKVAIKLLHARRPTERDGGPKDADLLQEAKALAQFSHPNVVAVYDVGTHDFGQTAIGVAAVPGPLPFSGVFVVMEFVDGPTLSGWQAQGERSWHDVLAVFREAGEGLAAAHAAGIVHRDFKPGNVLIGADGRARVLDFGLAGPLAEDDAPQRVVMGTPGYMAPEQLEGQPAGARADQYAFCVALFEALQGRRPRPAQDPETPAASALANGFDDRRAPAWIGRILARGLASAPADRWDNMRALLDALQRDPVARRRRWLTTIGVGGLVGLGGLGMFLNREDPAQVCELDPALLTGVWDAATREQIQGQVRASGIAEPDQRMQKLSQEIDRYLEGWVTLRRQVCEDTIVRQQQSPQVMGERMTCLDRRLRRVAGLTRLLGSADRQVVQHSLETVAGLPPVATCTRTPSTLGAAWHLEPDVERQVLDVEADAARADALVRSGKFSEAVAVAGEAVERARSTRHRAALASALATYAAALRSAGDLERAQSSIDEAMTLAEAAGDDDTATLAMTTAVRILDSRGRYESAGRIATLAQARVARLEAGGPREAQLLFNVGVLGLHDGSYQEALDALERARVIRENTYGARHHLVGSVHNTIGNVHQRRGEPARAREHLSLALEIWRESLGPQHPDIARVLNNLGNTIKDLGDYAEALATYQAALDAYEATFEPGHPSLAIIHHNLGRMAELLGDRTEAIARYQYALAIREQRLGLSHPLTASTLRGLGSVLQRVERVDEAIDALNRALEIEQHVADDGQRDSIETLDGLATAHARRGEIEVALGYHNRAGRILERASTDADTIANHHAARGETLRMAHKHEAAVEAFTLELRHREQGQSHPSTLWANARLGRALIEAKREQEGRELLEAALPALVKRVSRDHPDLQLLAPGDAASG